MKIQSSFTHLQFKLTWVLSLIQANSRLIYLTMLTSYICVFLPGLIFIYSTKRLSLEVADRALIIAILMESSVATPMHTHWSVNMNRTCHCTWLTLAETDF